MLGEVDQPLGRHITRQQLDAHRDGLLFGASARNGQLVRAIQLQRGDTYLKKAAKAYDYIELPLEPYDVGAKLCRISSACGVPACAVQCATLPMDDIAAYHAHCAITKYWGQAVAPPHMYRRRSLPKASGSCIFFQRNRRSLRTR